MRHQHDSHTLFFERIDHAEEYLRLFFGERRRRLVEDQQPTVIREGFGDLHELLFRNAQTRNALFHVDVDFELAHDLPCLAREQLFVDDAQLFQRLARNEEILRHIKLRQQVEFLMHDANALSVDVRRAVNRQRLPHIDDLSRVRLLDAGDDLDERRFTRAVLTHQGEHFSCADIHAHIVQHLNARISLGDVFCTEDDPVLFKLQYDPSLERADQSMTSPELGPSV